MPKCGLHDRRFTRICADMATWPWRMFLEILGEIWPLVRPSVSGNFPGNMTCCAHMSPWRQKLQETGISNRFPADSIVSGAFHPISRAEKSPRPLIFSHSRCRKTCDIGPIKIVRHEKRRQGKGAHVCTKMYIHRDFYDRTLAPKREIDVLRARSPAGSHL